MIVLDASAVIELILNTEAGRRVATAIADPSNALSAPHVLDLEVAQALRRYVQSDAISPKRGLQAIEHLGQLDVARYSHQELLPRIWALRENLTAYDAAYVALAEVLEAPPDAATAGRRHLPLPNSLTCQACPAVVCSRSR